MIRAPTRMTGSMGAPLSLVGAGYLILPCRSYHRDRFLPAPCWLFFIIHNVNMTGIMAVVLAVVPELVHAAIAVESKKRSFSLGWGSCIGFERDVLRAVSCSPELLHQLGFMRIYPAVLVWRAASVRLI